LEDLEQQLEIYKLKILSMKKDEMSLAAEKEKLNIERNLHMREMKRIHDEDQSRFNNFPLLKERYILLNLLGKGGFSEVYKVHLLFCLFFFSYFFPLHQAFDLQEIRTVACKIHQLNSQWSEKKKENYTKHAVREYNIHKSVVHPKIVQLYDVFEIDDNSFATILEYCDGPDLDLYLKMQQYLPEREAKSIISQIFSGLRYLTEQKRSIIHYDLKPGNILFSGAEVKMTDFGERA
jgi:tousled-like kinase